MNISIPTSDLAGAVDAVDTLIAGFRKCHADGITDVEFMTQAMIEAVIETDMPPTHIIGQQVMMLAVCLQRLAMANPPMPEDLWG